MQLSSETQKMYTSFTQQYYFQYYLYPEQFVKDIQKEQRFSFKDDHQYIIYIMKSLEQFYYLTDGDWLNKLRCNSHWNTIDHQK